MLPSIVVLALTSLVAAQYGFNAVKAPQRGLLAPGTGSQALNLGLYGSCDSFEKTCDDYCIPSGGECCGEGTGAYCDVGKYCVSNGCCEDGETCSGPPVGCDDDKKLCGEYCIPEGTVCCYDGYYCDAGETCTSDGKCAIGGSGGDDSDDDDDSSSSGGQCYDFQEVCGDGCMPEGSVCCDDGYCLSGETCTSDGRCRYGGSSGGDDGDGDYSSSYTYTSVSYTYYYSSSSESSFSAPSVSIPSFTATVSTISSAPIPTGPVSGDGDSDSSSSNDDTPGAAAANAPSFLVGLFAALPLLL